jgi:hypothetical protein
MDPQREDSVCSCVTMQGKIFIMKTAGKSSENVEDFTYLGETVNKQNHIHREAKNRLKSVNICHCAYQNLLSSCFVSQNIIKSHNSRVSCDVLQKF